MDWGGFKIWFNIMKSPQRFLDKIATVIAPKEEQRHHLCHVQQSSSGHKKLREFLWFKWRKTQVKKPWEKAPSEKTLSPKEWRDRQIFTLRNWNLRKKLILEGRDIKLVGWIWRPRYKSSGGCSSLSDEWVECTGGAALQTVTHAKHKSSS